MYPVGYPLMRKQDMSAFWRNWLNAWAWVVIVFGLVLAGGGLDATDTVAEAAFAIVGGGAPLEWTPHLRFSVALMGAVTMGWGVTYLALFMAAHRLGADAAPVWRLATIGMVAWFVIDSALSVATGFWMNAVSNTGLAIGYLVPVLASGAMNGSAPAAGSRPSARAS
jgi:hypothetical protein